MKEKSKAEASEPQMNTDDGERRKQKLILPAGRQALMSTDDGERRKRRLIAEGTERTLRAQRKATARNGGDGVLAVFLGGIGVCVGMEH